MLYKLKPANWEAQSLCESPGQEDQSLRDNRGYCQEPGSNLSKIFLGREEVRSLSVLPVFGAGATSGRPKPRMKPIIRHMSQGPGGWKLLAGLSVYLRSAINPTGWGWEFYRDILRHSLKLTAFRKCFFPSLPPSPWSPRICGRTTRAACKRQFTAARFPVKHHPHPQASDKGFSGLPQPNLEARAPFQGPDSKLSEQNSLFFPFFSFFLFFKKQAGCGREGGLTLKASTATWNSVHPTFLLNPLILHLAP